MTATRIRTGLLLCSLGLFAACSHGSSDNIVPITQSLHRSQNSALGTWTEKVLFAFKSSDEIDLNGPFVKDEHGDLFGTVDDLSSGTSDFFELTPSSSGLRETVLYRFERNRPTGSYISGVARDASGNFWGVVGVDNVFVLHLTEGKWTAQLVHSCGKVPGLGYSTPAVAGSSIITKCDGPRGVFELLQIVPSGHGFKVNVITHMGSDTSANGGFAEDSHGDLYGTSSSSGGPYPGPGPTYELKPAAGRFTYHVLFRQYDSFVGPALGPDGSLFQRTS